MPRALPYLLLLPGTIFLAVLFLYPFLLVAVEALTRDGAWPTDNFQRMANHWKFPVALRNTFILAAMVVPIQLALALAMSSIVMGLEKGRSTILYIFAIPLGVSDLAAGLIWLAIFEQKGFLNSFLAGFGVIDQPVLVLGYQTPWIIFLAIILAEIWRATAIMVVILVAGMGLIPKEYAGAAEVFGASRWQRFRRVTLPLLRPSLQTALVFRVILAFEVFAVVVSQGGSTSPVQMSETYQWQFELQDRGVAAAYVMVILGISVAFTLLILRLLHVPKEARI